MRQTSKIRLNCLLVLLSILPSILISCNCENRSSVDGKAVDLGLSVKWANHDVGAQYATNDGERFTAEKVPTNFDNPLYKYHLEWSDGWRVPTAKEWKELLRECNWEFVTINGVDGYKATGKNGACLFFPYNSAYWFDGHGVFPEAATASGQIHNDIKIRLYGFGEDYEYEKHYSEFLKREAEINANNSSLFGRPVNFEPWSVQDSEQRNLRLVKR